jgi:hypothetical protein
VQEMSVRGVGTAAGRLYLVFFLASAKTSMRVLARGEGRGRTRYPRVRAGWACHPAGSQRRSFRRWLRSASALCIPARTAERMGHLLGCCTGRQHATGHREQATHVFLRELAERERAQQRRLSACAVADDHELPANLRVCGVSAPAGAWRAALRTGPLDVDISDVGGECR